MVVWQGRSGMGQGGCAAGDRAGRGRVRDDPGHVAGPPRPHLARPRDRLSRGRTAMIRSCPARHGVRNSRRHLPPDVAARWQLLLQPCRSPVSGRDLAQQVGCPVRRAGPERMQQARIGQYAVGSGGVRHRRILPDGQDTACQVPGIDELKGSWPWLSTPIGAVRGRPACVLKSGWRRERCGGG